MIAISLVTMFLNIQSLVTRVHKIHVPEQIDSKKYPCCRVDLRGVLWDTCGGESLIGTLLGVALLFFRQTTVVYTLDQT